LFNYSNYCTTCFTTHWGDFNFK